MSVLAQRTTSRTFFRFLWFRYKRFPPLAAYFIESPSSVGLTQTVSLPGIALSAYWNSSKRTATNSVKWFARRAGSGVGCTNSTRHQIRRHQFPEDCFRGTIECSELALDFNKSISISRPRISCTLLSANSRSLFQSLLPSIPPLHAYSRHRHFDRSHSDEVSFAH